MPQVPVAKRQVSTSPLPGARRTAAETPESRGAQLFQQQARTGEAIGRLGATVADVATQELGRELTVKAKMVEDERKRADEVALTNAQNRLDQFEITRLHDPKTGALNVHGQASFTLPEDVAKDYNELSAEIRAGLGTDEQRVAFAKLAQQRGANIDLTLRRHVSAEMDAFDKGETDATVTNASSLAAANALDPPRVAMELQRGIDAIRGYGKRHGIGPEAIQKQVDGFLSDTHLGVIDNLVAAKEPGKARAYFEEVKPQIAGDKYDDVEKLLKVGHTKKEAQQQSDKIIAAGGTLDEQRAKAKQISDPDVRDETLSYIEHEFDVKDKAERDRLEGTNKLAYDIVDRTKSVKDIPATVWKDMTGPQRNAIRDYAASLAKGEPIRTDYQTYYALMAMSSTPAGTKLPDGRVPLNVNDFIKEDLTKYRNSLSDSDYKQMIELQSSIRNADQKKADALQLGYMTNAQIVDGVLQSAGYDTTPAPGADAKAVYDFRAAVDKQVAAQELSTGKKASNDDVKRIADELITRVTLQKGTWGGLFTSAPYYDVTKRLVDVTLDDMSAETRAQAAEWLRSKGQPVTDETLLNAFRKLLLVQQQQQQKK
jgi:hypothetical protein